jgi:hypothetical protein
MVQILSFPKKHELEALKLEGIESKQAKYTVTQAVPSGTMIDSR